MKPLFKSSLVLLFLFAVAVNPSLGMISVGNLSKERAAKMGITMKSRKNGDAGVKVWLEFKKEGVLEHFTYAELRMEDEEGNHLVSAMLRTNPVHHRQSPEITSVAFSAEPAQLKKCSFMVVAYGSSAGDVGYVLKVTDFLEPAALRGE